MSHTTVVVGLGEVGKPLFELVERAGHTAVGIDVEPTALPAKGDADVMHVCFPFQIADFVGETLRYVELLEPRLTIVNSTIAVGTTREIHDRGGRPIAYSPVRGKHSRMVDEFGALQEICRGHRQGCGRLRPQPTSKASGCPHASCRHQRRPSSRS